MIKVKLFQSKGSGKAEGNLLKVALPPRMSKLDGSRYEAAPQRTPWQLKGK